jgi:hypothetical protein
MVTRDEYFDLINRIEELRGRLADLQAAESPHPATQEAVARELANLHMILTSTLQQQTAQVGGDGPGADVEDVADDRALGEQPPQVRADRPGADVEHGADLLVRETVGDQPHDLALAGAETDGASPGGDHDSRTCTPTRGWRHGVPLACFGSERRKRGPAIDGPEASPRSRLRASRRVLSPGQRVDSAVVVLAGRRDVLDAWRDADEDLELLRQVKAEVAKLGS